ncbi:MAG: CRISPR-associated endonuclease Cas3'' [Burkholderiaceae bacterium]
MTILTTRDEWLLWAKSSHRKLVSTDLLVLHLLDVAACADAVLAREPESMRKRPAAVLVCRDAGEAGLLLLIACHDLGKGCPGFQRKWKIRPVSMCRSKPDTAVNHAFVSQVALREFLIGLSCQNKQRNWLQMQWAVITANAQVPRR